MSDDREPFLTRWSRLKREAPVSKDAPPAQSGAPEVPARVQAPPPAPLPELPDIETLTPDSDFKPFMDSRVDPSLRRSALKRLFSDARFNLPDPFEAYSGDYTKEEPIPLEMLKTLNQARKLLFDERQPVPETSAEKPEPLLPEQTNGAGRQDA